MSRQKFPDKESAFAAPPNALNRTVLVCCLIATILIEAGVLYLSTLNAKERAQHRAEQSLISMSREVQTGFDAARTLSLFIYERNGELLNFDHMGRAIVNRNPSIYCAQLAPQGRVQHVWPPERMAATKADYLGDHDWQPQAEFDREHRLTSMLGPLPLRHGVSGLLIRQPVYLGDKKYPDQFWGFAVIVMDVDRILERSQFKDVADKAYDYELAELRPDGRQIIARKVEGHFKEPVSVTTNIYGRTWQLSIENKRGWLNTPLMVIMTFVLVIVSVLLALLRQNMLKLNAKNELLEQASTIDPLTQIFNRRGFEVMERHMLQDYEQALLAIIDVNEFKSFNDLYGHAAGDELLKKLAQELKTLAKEFAGVAGRSGGDEFCLVLPVTQTEGGPALQAFAQRAHSFSYQGQEYAFNISLGYAAYPEQARDSAELGNKADIAVYHAKLNREERCCQYQPSFASETRMKMGFNINDIAKGLPVGILICLAAEEGRILFANDEMAQLLGCQTANEIVGLNWNDFIYPEDLPGLRHRVEIIERLRTKGQLLMNQCYYRHRILRVDDSVGRVAVIGRKMHHAHFGDIYYMLFYDQDTLRDNLTLELQERREERRQEQGTSASNDV